MLQMLGLRFSVMPADVEERRDGDERARCYVERLSRAKVAAIVGAPAGALVIGGDTIVVIDDRVLEKPRDAAEASGMLSLLSGRTHTVYSGLAVAAGARVASNVVAARVTFRDLTRELIDAYVATGEPLDKAGAYGIQGRGAVLVERIEGDFYAVMGLSAAALASLVREVGYEYLPGTPATLAPVALVADDTS